MPWSFWDQPALVTKGFCDYRSFLRVDSGRYFNMGLLPGFIQSCTSRFRWGSLNQRLEVGTCIPTWPYLERWNWWKIRFNIWTTVPKTLSSPVCFVRNTPLLTSTGVVDVWYVWIVYCSNQFTSIGWLVDYIISKSILFCICSSSQLSFCLYACQNPNFVDWITLDHSICWACSCFKKIEIWLRFLFSVGCIWATKILSSWA